MYSFNTRVRYSEVDSTNHADLPAILNYFQDCSIFHSADIGVGLDFLMPRHRAWLVSAWQIVIERFPKLGENLKVSTWPYEFKAFYGLRNFTLEDESGSVIAYANSIWINYDTEAGVPVKPTPEEMDPYIIETAFEMDYAPRKIQLPSEFTEYEAFPVQRSHLDNNNHVNNGVYISLASDFLPKGFKFRQMRADYRSQAHLGDMLHPRVSLEGNTCTIVLADDNGKPYVIVCFE